MKGKVKSGQGTLVGNAGEYYVMAELLKRGVIAALAPRNAPAFDILATMDKRTVRIRVKTKSEEYTDWQWMAKKDGRIFTHLDDEGDFSVLVNLAAELGDMEYYVVPTHTLNEWLLDLFCTWLDSPGKNGRPHSPDNRKRNLNENQSAEKLSAYRGNWNILWE